MYVLILFQVIPEFNAVRVAIDHLMIEDDEFTILPNATILSNLQKTMNCSDLSYYENQITTYIAYNKANASKKDNDSQVAKFIAFNN